MTENKIFFEVKFCDPTTVFDITFGELYISLILDI